RATAPSNRSSASARSIRRRRSSDEGQERDTRRGDPPVRIPSRLAASTTSSAWLSMLPPPRFLKGKDDPGRSLRQHEVHTRIGRSTCPGWPAGRKGGEACGLRILPL